MRADVPPANPLPAITVYTDDEINQFVSAARGRDLRWWVLPSLPGRQRRRVGEALSLRWEWFRLEDFPRNVKLPTNKTHRLQYIPLSKRSAQDVFTAPNILRLMHEQRSGRRAFKAPCAGIPLPLP